MNQQPPSRLDSFETALLTELRSVIAAAPAPRQAAVAPIGRITGRRRWYPVAAVAVVAAVVGVLMINWLRPTPAFAVSGGINSKVTVHVMRLEGAPALEKALAKHGIRADVTYLPQGKTCAPGRYKPIPAPGLTMAIGAKDFTITIPAGTVGKRDTFVLVASVAPMTNGFRARVDFDVARGPIAGCQVVPIH